VDWDEALDLWRDILGRVTHCAAGTVECVLLTPQDCQAMVVVMLRLAEEMTPQGFSVRRSRARHDL
jgi:hypothetical protein